MRKALGSRSIKILLSVRSRKCRPENMASSALPFTWHSVFFRISKSLLPPTLSYIISPSGCICAIFCFSNSHASRSLINYYFSASRFRRSRFMASIRDFRSNSAWCYLSSRAFNSARNVLVSNFFLSSMLTSASRCSLLS